MCGRLDGLDTGDCKKCGARQEYLSHGLCVDCYGDNDLQGALSELKDAMDFYDKVKKLKGDERLAVGTDHYDWLILAADRVIKAYQ